MKETECQNVTASQRVNVTVNHAGNQTEKEGLRRCLLGVSADVSAHQDEVVDERVERT